jgi:hypothetical protein
MIDKLAESRISEAIERGELDDLPGQGKRLSIEDNALVPEELRMAYRVLKNSGYLPREVTLRREINSIEHLLSTALSEEQRRGAQKKLVYLTTQLQATSRACSLLNEQQYVHKIQVRLK